MTHLCEREGLREVETVVASGNVLFSFDERPSYGLEELLGAMMAEQFEIQSFAAVRSRAELAEAIDDNPFAADGDEGKVHTLFLSAQPDPAAYAKMIADHAPRGPDRIALGPRSLYVDYVNGAGRSTLSHAFVERRLRCRATARNLRSLRRMLEKMA